jgi:hypothetical protein
MVFENIPIIQTQEIETMVSGHAENLMEYIESLRQVIRNDEEDIQNVSRMANIFLAGGQFENYGYLMERIHETELRIETCRECIRECEENLGVK